MQDYKLAFRMLLKFPGLTIAGGLALAVAIAFGAGWYDLWGKLFSPIIPLPDGDRIVLIETQNTATNSPEPRILHDFLEWRRELRTVEDLGAYRTETRNLIVANQPPEPIQIAELTAAAFRTARVAPLLGRPLLDSDERPGAQRVVLLGHDVWQRVFDGRDVVGSIVTLGDTTATVIGVMPEGFTYPVNHDGWAPLQLRVSYDALEGSAISVVGRLAPGVTRAQADAELRVRGTRAAAAMPGTHEHLLTRVRRPGETDVPGLAQVAMTSLPGLLVLALACLTVGTLVYARTATREGEIALRSALGATRTRIVVQLFVEALVLAALAAAVGLIAADRTLRWGVAAVYADSGGAPFWMTSGLGLTTVLYASALAIVCAAMLSLLPALKATQGRLQSQLANLGSGGATLRFGRIWTTAMIAQVALTVMSIPVAMEATYETMLKLKIRGEFPSQEYLAARIDVERQPDETVLAFEGRRAGTIAALERRLAEEPGVIAVTFADRVPGSTPASREAEVEAAPGAGSAYETGFATRTVGPGFFEAFDRPVVAGRDFNESDRVPTARTVIVNEAFARDFQQGQRGSPIGVRLRYPGSARSDTPAGEWFEIVGVVRDFGLDPDDEGHESPYVFHTASAGTIAPLVMNVHVRGNPAPLVARFPFMAAGVDGRLVVQELRTLEEWIRQRDMNLTVPLGVQLGVTALVLFLSAMGIFSLMSVSVSRRTREIGLRAALGATPHQILGGVMSRAMRLAGGGIAAGGALLLWGAALLGPTGRPADDVKQFIVWLAMTAVVMLVACLLACVQPAGRALRINPIEALRES